MTKNNTLNISKVLILIILFIFPIFGKSLDFKESIFFYSLPSILLFYFIIFERKHFYLSKLQLGIVLSLVILFLISTVLSSNPGISFMFFFIFINVVIMALIAIKVIKPNSYENGLILFSIIYSIVFLLNQLNIISLSSGTLSDNFILQIYGHSYLADFIVFSIPLIINKISKSSIVRQKYLLFFTLILITSTLILSNSRSAIIALFIGLLFFKTGSLLQKYLKIVFILGSLLVLLFFSLPSYQSKYKKTYDGNRIQYWTIALKSFKESPLFGNGPYTFSILKNKFQSIPVVGNSAHNSFLSFLTENGIVFTIIFFTIITLSLAKTIKTNNLFFVCSLIAIIHSFFDPTWSSPGIFIISLYFIFYEPVSIKNKNIQSHTSIMILGIICFVYFLLDSISNYFLLQNNLKLSIVFNPFNINSRLLIISKENQNNDFWKNNLSFTLKYFKDKDVVYESLIKVKPFPEKEQYFYRLIDLNPKESYISYLLLATYYNENNDYSSLEKLLNLIDQNFSDENKFLPIYAIPLSKIAYKHALYIYQSNPQKSINYFRITQKLFPDLGHYHVEYANSLWQTGQKDKAVNHLSNVCQTYKWPKKHCQLYLESKKNTKFNEPGSEEYLNYINNDLELSKFINL